MHPGAGSNDIISHLSPAFTGDRPAEIGHENSWAFRGTKSMKM